MRNLDFSPLMRSTVGYDRISQLFEGMERATNGDKYPPYNIIKNDQDSYSIVMAVAGFSEGDIRITATHNSLEVSGETKDEQEDVEYLHRGIAGRAFTQTFELADTIKVVGAEMENGLLKIALQREIPEAMKPRTISITKADDIAA
ncbi:Hsp20 family protein [Sneathiella sp. P13V-1]|uniref:Hsp20 family protein n=1 Tax=Sneathiella sp. P13V-1 TaxID=2697366 RepID=UPI00187BAAA9|nr:Hsp20 family protein [Sneathiella sp. P13V-1]MBE7637995.1 Hsp20 family protein [Sneathiella sp. P13V-1]